MPDRQMNRAKDRQREWLTDGRMERRADRQMDGETNEQTAEVYKNIVAFDTPPFAFDFLPRITRLYVNKAKYTAND